MVVTDPVPACGRPLPDVVAECVEAGATAIQLRDKRAVPAELLATARVLRDVTRSGNALFIVNDNLDVALGAEADGVHLGPDDLPVDAARRLAPQGFLIGASCDQPLAARRLVAAGADYLGIGSVFATRTKREARGEAIGLARLATVVRAAEVPCVGIGGITPATAAGVFQTGAGVAVVSAVLHAADPGSAVRELLRTRAPADTPTP